MIAVYVLLAVVGLCVVLVIEALCLRYSLSGVVRVVQAILGPTAPQTPNADPLRANEEMFRQIEQEVEKTKLPWEDERYGWGMPQEEPDDAQG